MTANSQAERNDLFRCIACAVGGGVAAVTMYNVLQRPRNETIPPRLCAGKVMDLIVAEETWREIKPHHLPGCECSVCKPENGSQTPHPMQPTTPPSLKRAPSSKDWKEALIEQSEFGFRPYPRASTRPFKVYAGLNMSEQARIYKSSTFDDVIRQAANRPVDLLGESGITFQTIFDMIAKPDGHSVYVYGGVLRDIIMKGPHVADDIDVLFTCSVRELVARCEKRGWKRGEHFHLKKDEGTGALRYDYISIGQGKEKFSGHTLDSNCAGEFTFNCLLYDIGRQLLIDCPGCGVFDAANKRLRIPYDGGHISEDGRSQWELWSENCDRLPGMISLRFFNFRSRGYRACPATIEHNVRWLIHFSSGERLSESIQCFLKRKVLIKMDKDKDYDTAMNERLDIFKNALCTDFDQALGHGEGEKFWTVIVVPIVQKLRSQ